LIASEKGHIIDTLVFRAGDDFFAGILVAAQPASDVRLVLENSEQEYCSGDEDVGFLQITSDFRYQNIAKKSVLLLRHSHDVDLISIRAERPPGSQNAEHTLSLTTISEGINKAVNFGPRDFVNLKPGYSFVERKSFSIPFQKSGKSSTGELASGGRHWVRIRVSLWPGSDQEAARLQAEIGRNRIRIGTRATWSDPLLVDIHADNRTRSCATR
jgi:hypothetical protein